MQIESRELRAGSCIATEAEIVQCFGVSRTVVREALSRLQAAGAGEDAPWNRHLRLRGERATRSGISILPMSPARWMRS